MINFQLTDFSTGYFSVVGLTLSVCGHNAKHPGSSPLQCVCVSHSGCFPFPFQIDHHFHWLLLMHLLASLKSISWVPNIRNGIIWYNWIVALSSAVFGLTLSVCGQGNKSRL
jgi:hypothetical protein